MWTPATRRQHSRAGLRSETDLTDEEWRLVEPLLPAPKRTGRPLRWPLREIFNAIFYVMRGGVAWRLLPSDLPPKSTAYRWFAAWRDKGVFEALNHALLMIDRERKRRAASPSACIIDSQSVKTSEGLSLSSSPSELAQGRKASIGYAIDACGGAQPRHTTKASLVFACRETPVTRYCLPQESCHKSPGCGSPLRSGVVIYIGSSSDQKSELSFPAFPFLEMWIVVITHVRVPASLQVIYGAPQHGANELLE